jgi:hypothetical protein
MFMILGAAVFLFLTGSAILGVVMFFIVSGLIVARTCRRAGLIMMLSGVIGAALGVITLVVLNWLLGPSDTPAKTWMVFGAAGYGWAALVSGGLVALIALLRQPNSWIERRKHGNA